jgi:hypothetical protein
VSAAAFRTLEGHLYGCEQRTDPCYWTTPEQIRADSAWDEYPVTWGGLAAVKAQHALNVLESE